jgi:hypothetical protein
MPAFKQVVFAAAAAAAIACTPLAPAWAGPHGFGHGHGYGHGYGHGWGVGYGLFGAAVALVTLPIAIASAAVNAGAQAIAGGDDYAPQQGYAPPAATGYAPPPAYYTAPPAYYAPPAAYYAPAPAYYPRSPVYYAPPRVYYAPHPGYGYGGYAGRGGYPSGHYPYQR